MFYTLNFVAQGYINVEYGLTLIIIYNMENMNLGTHAIVSL